MRYERKYKVSDLNHHVILQSIRMHPVGLRKIYPDRQINNIYFDSNGLQCYHDNVHGVSERKKFRVRWYGEDVFDIKNPNLGNVPRIRQSILKWIQLNPDTNWLYKKLISQIHKVNQENFDYILKFVENLQLTEYNENQQ